MTFLKYPPLMFSAPVPITPCLWANIQLVTLPATVRPSLLTHLIIRFLCVTHQCHVSFFYCLLPNTLPLMLYTIAADS